MKKILIFVLSLMFFSAFSATLQKTEAEENTVTCSFTSQVVNVDSVMSYDEYGNPEVAGWVYFGYWRYNSSQRRLEAVSTHQVFATKEWMPDLRAALFDPRRPSIQVNSELYYGSYDDCNSSYRGTVSYIRVNPSFKMEEYSGGGGGGGKGSPENPGK